MKGSFAGLFAIIQVATLDALSFTHDRPLVACVGKNEMVVDASLSHGVGRNIVPSGWVKAPRGVVTILEA